MCNIVTNVTYDHVECCDSFWGMYQQILCVNYHQSWDTRLALWMWSETKKYYFNPEGCWAIVLYHHVSPSIHILFSHLTSYLISSTVVPVAKIEQYFVPSPECSHPSLYSAYVNPSHQNLFILVLENQQHVAKSRAIILIFCHGELGLISVENYLYLSPYSL